MAQLLTPPSLLVQTTSPIAFFCYKRPDHVRRTLGALRANYLAPQSKLFIFSDGPRDEQSREGVEQVRQYLHQVDGFASIEIIERDRNYGCAKNIIDGITQVVNEFGRVVIVEDDVLASPYFLNYINEALEIYKDDEKVCSAVGFCPNYGKNVQLPQSFFTRDGIWGWGTWQRAWKDYEYDADKLLSQLISKGILEEFDAGLKQQFYSNMLRSQAAGRLDTWDVQWRAVNFLHDRLSLFPGKTLTINIGLDGSGSHGQLGDNESVNTVLADSYEPLKRIPVELNQYIYGLQVAATKKLMPPCLPIRAVRKIWRILTGKYRRR